MFAASKEMGNIPGYTGHKSTVETPDTRPSGQRNAKIPGKQLRD